MARAPQPFVKIATGDSTIDRLQDRLVETLRSLIGFVTATPATVFIENTDYTAKQGDGYVGYRVLTATRAITLPDATEEGKLFIVADESGSAAAGVKLQVRAGTAGQFVDGTVAPGKVDAVIAAYGFATYRANGRSRWKRVA